MTQLENTNQYLDDQDIISNDLMEILLDAAPSVAPPSTLRAKVLARIHGPTSMKELITLRGNEGNWIQVHRGIEIKVLFQDQDSKSRSLLMRVHAGASFPAHEHDGVEECLVLEGEFNMGDLTLRAGDYHLAPQGAAHTELTSRTGALLFFRTCVTQYPLA